MSDQQTQYNIFISYKREDQEFAEALHLQLIAWDYRVWMDVHCIPAGSHWPSEIEKGLRASQTVIGVMSPLAVQSRNVQNEWEWAIVHEKRLIPLMLQSCDVPLNLIRLNYLDFTSSDRTVMFERLRAELASPAPGAESPPDPYRDYLQQTYALINRYLAQKIIKTRPDDAETPDPIPLDIEHTPNAVLFEQREEIHPLYALGGAEPENTPPPTGDFRAAFEHFDRRVLLLGEPGAGKTITLLNAARDAVVQRMQDPAQPIAILGIIPTWDAREQPPIADWLAESQGAPPDAQEVIESGQALLLLDGLDELGAEREEDDPHNPSQKLRYDPRQRFMNALVGVIHELPLPGLWQIETACEENGRLFLCRNGKKHAGNRSSTH